MDNTAGIPLNNRNFHILSDKKGGGRGVEIKPNAGRNFFSAPFLFSF
jgi:hypothetical protein